jgi:serine/threonine protein kinase
MSKRCQQCQSEIPSGSLEQLCPQCLSQTAPRVRVAGGDSDPTALAPTVAHTPTASGFVPPPREALQSVFPQLEILELLGKGGMGAVYKAKQRGLDRLVAVKILPPEFSQNPGFAQRFLREAKALAMLSHPNIVGVHDVGQAGGFCYFIMEFVDGVNLRQAMRAARLKPAEALRIVPQICDALQFAHDEGIVHRDIKPENILIDKKGRVKIADFGLAKLLDKTPSDLSLTGPQQVMGTINYMAPEQLEGARDVDHRADIYSLGVTFYEMLTGELPIGRFAAPSKRAYTDARLDEVVLRSLEKAPAERYQNANDIKTDVEAISRDQPAPPADSIASTPKQKVPRADPQRSRGIAKKAMGIAVWSIVCILVYFGVWSPDGSGGAYLDREVWPHYRENICTLSLKPNFAEAEKPSYRRLVITEKRRIEGSGAYVNNGTQVRHEFIVELEASDGKTQEIHIDALDNWSYSVADDNKEPRPRQLLDVPAASAWMNRAVSGQEHAKGATAKDIDEQARFWVTLIQSQHAIWLYAERLDRRASASLDAYRQKKAAAPFSIVSGEENVLREPSTVPIQYVGVPLMVAVGAIGALFILLVRRSKE